MAEDPSSTAPDARNDAKRQPRRQRRWFTRIILSVVIGATLTIAIAWGAAAFHRVDYSGTLTRGAGGLGYDGEIVFSHAQGYQTWCGTRLMWIWHYLDDRATRSIGDEDRLQQRLQIREVLKSQDQFAPEWSRVRNSPSNTGTITGQTAPNRNVTRFEDAWGFPFRAFTAIYMFNPTLRRFVPLESSEAIELSPFAPAPNSPNLSRHRAIPLQIHSPGLLLNTLFWSVIAFVLIAAWCQVRDRRRRWRGRCVQCCYDLRSQIDQSRPSDVDDDRRCPECGTAF